MSRRTCVALLVVAAAQAWQAGEEPHAELRDQEQRDNVRWGKPHMTRDERKAAEAAGEIAPQKTKEEVDASMRDFEGVPPMAAAPADAKNVLMIVVDDLRPQFNLAYEHSFMKTPALDEFALSKGTVTFTRAYAQVAHCSPSRNSFMTSRYPDTLKIWNVNTDFRNLGKHEGPPNPGIFPIPHWFKRNGYLVFGGGKVYHPNHPKANDKPFSWSDGTKLGGKIKYFNDHDHDCPLPPPSPPGSTPTWEHWEQEKSAFRGGSDGDTNHVGCGGCVEDKPDELFYDGRLANWTIRALQAVRRDAQYGEKRPFFIAAGFRRPHTPWNVAQRFVDMYPAATTEPPKHPAWAQGAPECAFVCGGDGVGCDFGVHKQRPTEWSNLCRRTYYACVSATDHYIGTVLAELARLEMKKNTVVALFGDHGWHLGEGGLWAKYTNMEHATRVPLMIRAPWLTEGQTEQILGKLYGHQNNASGHQNARSSMSQRVVRSSTFVELVDIFPTLVDLAGIPQPPHLEGRSLKQAMVSPWEKTHRPMAQSQFAHCCQWGSFDSHRECGACEKLPNERISYMGYAVRNADFRFVAWYRWDGPAELPHCEGLMAVELYKHVGDDGLGDLSFDGDFEAVNLAANITLGDPAAMRLEMHMNGSHASTTKNMHEHLLQKFPKTFGRCSPGVPMRLHPRKFPVSKLTKGHDGVLSPFEEAASWPPDTTCPDPE